MIGTIQGSLIVSILCFLYTEVTSGDVQYHIIVETAYGKVQGIVTEQAKVFKSVPYGGPVSGDNRWKEAGYPKPWTGILDGTVDPPACPQTMELVQDEDCLFLNVYTPLDSNPDSKLPVMVFIHGGSFIFGYSAFEIYDGSYLANNSNIVVVTINYRLGALGFLVYGRGPNAIEGNFGIKDQRLALKWVQKNIAAFGGDPNRITLSGESAGAMSVAIHMTNMKSNGLFHKAIIQSDAFGDEYKTTVEERERGDGFARNLGCWFPNDFECLRQKDVEEILQGKKPEFESDIYSVWANFLTWEPVIDGNELAAQTLELFEAGQYIKIPMIMGTTGAEGLTFVYEAIEYPILPVLYPSILSLLFGPENTEAALELYPPGPPGTDQRPQIAEAVTDYAFYCPAILSAQSITCCNSSAPVYSYVFDHGPAINELLSETTFGVCQMQPCHGFELPYVFHTAELLVMEYTPEERELADNISGYWGNFVNTGDPNEGQNAEHKDVEECKDSTCWPLFSTEPTNWESLIMESPSSQVQSEYRKSYCDVVNTFGYHNRDSVFAALQQAASLVVPNPY